MKFNKGQVNAKELKVIEEKISFSNLNKPLLVLKDINVKATLFKDANLINVYLEIKGTAKVECAYTLEAVDYPINFSESIDISEDETNLETYYVPTNLVDLDPIILDLIKGEIPTRVVKQGAKLHVEGEGYRVISEDDLNKEKEEVTSSPFDKLKDLDL